MSYQNWYDSAMDMDEDDGEQNNDYSCEYNMDGGEEQQEEYQEEVYQEEGVDYCDDTPPPPCRPPCNTKEVLQASYHIQYCELAQRTIKTIYQTQQVVAVDCKGPPKKISLLQVATFEGLCFIYDLYVCPDIMTFGQLGALLREPSIVKVMYDCSLYCPIIFKEYNVCICNVFDAVCAHMIIKMQKHHIHPLCIPRVSINTLSCRYGRGLLNVAPHVIRRLASANSRFWEKRPLTRKLCNYAARGALCLVPELYTRMIKKIRPGNKTDFDKLVTKKLAYPMEDHDELYKKYHHHLKEVKKYEEKLQTMGNSDDNNYNYNYPAEQDEIEGEVEVPDDENEAEQGFVDYPTDQMQGNSYPPPVASRKTSTKTSRRKSTRSTGFIPMKNSRTPTSNTVPRPPKKVFPRPPKPHKNKPRKVPYQVIPRVRSSQRGKTASPRRKTPLKTKWPNGQRPRRPNPAVACDQDFDNVEPYPEEGYESECGKQPARTWSCRPPQPPIRSPVKQQHLPGASPQNQNVMADPTAARSFTTSAVVNDKPSPRGNSLRGKNSPRQETFGFSKMRDAKSGGSRLGPGSKCQSQMYQPVSLSRWPKPKDADHQWEGDVEKPSGTQRRKGEYFPAEDPELADGDEELSQDDLEEMRVRAMRAAGHKRKKRAKFLSTPHSLSGSQKRKREYCMTEDLELDDREDELSQDDLEEMRVKAMKAAAPRHTKRAKFHPTPPSPRLLPEVMEKNSMDSIINQYEANTRQNPQEIYYMQSPHEGDENRVSSERDGFESDDDLSRDPDYDSDHHVAVQKNSRLRRRRGTVDEDADRYEIDEILDETGESERSSWGDVGGA